MPNRQPRASDPDTSEEDILEEKPAKQSKKDKPSVGAQDDKPDTWSKWVKNWASKQGVSYRDAMRDPECQAGWKEAKPVKEKKTRVKKAKLCPHCQEEL